MPARVGFSVSAVSPAWLDELPAVGSPAAPAPLLVFIVVEHWQEGDFVLERYREKLLRVPDKPFVEFVEVWPRDPPALWTRIFGGPDNPSLFEQLPPGTAVFVRGGGHLDDAAWQRFVPALRRFADGWRCAVVTPVHRSVFAYDPALFDSCGRVFEVPPFASFTKQSRRDLAKALLDAAGVEDSQWLSERLVDASPLNRTELEDWVYACRSSDAQQRLGLAFPPWERNPGVPLPWRSRQDLASEFRSIRAIIDDTDRELQRTTGMQFFKPLRQPFDPFSSRDLRACFVECVSFVACLYFDSTEPAFRTLLNFRLGAGNDVVAERPDAFFGDIRALRTRYQHGLDWGRSQDRETRDRVHSWFVRQCKTAAPGEDDWRMLCDALLREWRRVVESMLSVARALPSAAGRDAVLAQLRRGATSMSQEQWVDAMVDCLASMNLDRSLDGKELVRRNLTGMNDKLRMAAPTPDGVQMAARAIAAAVVLSSLAHPPVDGRDFVAQGVPPGPRVGEALKVAQRCWDAGFSGSPEELIEKVLLEIGLAAEQGVGARITLRAE